MGLRVILDIVHSHSCSNDVESLNKSAQLLSCFLFLHLILKLMLMLALVYLQIQWRE